MRMIQSKRITLLWLFLYCLTLITNVHWTWKLSYQQLHIKNQQQLDRFSLYLENQLGHYAYIPHLLAPQEIVINALQGVTIAHSLSSLTATSHRSIRLSAYQILTY